MKFYWFGDSWLVGDELELAVPYDQRTQYVFAQLFSDHYDVECINLGESGSSPDIIPWKFNHIKNQLQSDDIVFFCLSPSHRTSRFNNEQIHEQIIPGPNHNKNVHAYAAKWYKYFDTAPQRLYNYDCIIGLLWLWCQQLGIRCYFTNLFTTEPNTMLKIVPDTAWLLPRDQCIAQLIMPIIDNDSGTVVDNDNPKLTTVEWDLQKKFLEMYVRPGYCHPNIQGHQHIANKLIEIYDRLRVSTTNT